MQMAAGGSHKRRNLRSEIPVKLSPYAVYSVSVLTLQADAFMEEFVDGTHRVMRENRSVGDLSDFYRICDSLRTALNEEC